VAKRSVARRHRGRRHQGVAPTPVPESLSIAPAPVPKSLSVAPAPVPESAAQRPRRPPGQPGTLPPSLFIIGWGKVGAALGTQAQAAGLRLLGVETRDRARLRRAARAVGSPNAPLAAADAIALTVPDGALAEVAAALAARLRPGQVVFHASGSLDLEPLRPLAERGARIGSLHPFCSIASAATPLAGCACAIDGGAQARRILHRLALAVGLRPLARPPTDRLRYHLAAVLTVAGAGVAAVASERLLRAAGAPSTAARAALAGLLRSAAFNLEQSPGGGTLTGPFARGDLDRIRRQLDALQGDADAQALYRLLGRLSSRLAAGLSDAQRRAIEGLLKEPSKAG
jgi:predicted short-subunit dehydrogenase-like oxidoreductase (DUF2520 family)